MAATDDLVTLARVLPTLPGDLSTEQSASIPALIAAASKAIVRFCRRTFWVDSFDEVRTPQAGQWDRGEPDLIQLRHFPVRSVTRVAAGRTTALTITNTSSSNQRAYVSTVLSGDPEVQQTITGLTLTRVASAVTSSSTLTFASYPTIAALAAAVVALGNGWTATVPSGADLFASADLLGPEGPTGCLATTAGPGGNAAAFDLFTVDVSGWQLATASGEVRFTTGMGTSYNAGPGPWWHWPMSAGLDVIPGQWRPEVRVSYTAGYATIPDDVQQACAITVQQMYYDQVTANVIRRESMGQYSYELVAPDDSIPDSARVLLAPYRIFEA